MGHPYQDIRWLFQVLAALAHAAAGWAGVELLAAALVFLAARFLRKTTLAEVASYDELHPALKSPIPVLVPA